MGRVSILVSLTQPHLTNPFHTHLLLLLLFFWQYSQFDLNCFYMVDGDYHHDHDRDQLLFLSLPFWFSEQFSSPSAPRRTNGIPFVTVHRLFFFLVNLTNRFIPRGPVSQKCFVDTPSTFRVFFITVSFFWPPCVGRAANVRVCATRRPSFYPFYPYPLGAAFFFLKKKKTHLRNVFFIGLVTYVRRIHPHFNSAFFFFFPFWFLISFSWFFRFSLVYGFLLFFFFFPLDYNK